MGVFAGPEITESGLVLALDVGNRKTFANSLINSTSWSLGSGSATGYSQNGATAENERVTGTDPFGKSATVWETRPQGNTADDGGWNSDSVAIDSTKLYRFSVWVKRTTDSTGGTFYFGTSSNVRRTDNNEYAGNPYWDCRGPGFFTKDVWYLVVGHCYPYNTTYTGQHPETGIYTVAEGTTKVASINSCNIGPDLKWAGSNESATVHRCYHYYCPDNTTRLQFFDPRIDVIDGTEPSIANLLSGFTANRLTDLIGTNNGTFVNGPTYSTANGGSLSFDGSDEYVDCPSITVGSSYSIECFFNSSSVVSYRNLYDMNYSTYSGVSGNVGPRFEQFSDGTANWVWSGVTNANDPYNYTTAFPLSANTWYHTVFTMNGGIVNTYVNGNIQNSNISSPNGYVTTFGDPNLGRGFVLAGNRYFSGKISNTKIYNRALTAAEISQNFNALRGRYGI